MTSERKKAIVFLIITLIIGIFIGTLVPSFYSRMRHGEWKHRGRTEQQGDRRAGFEKMIIRILKADSSQVKKIRPILDETSVKIGALEKGSSARMMGIMDSMKVQLQPILSDEQMKSLEEFSQRNRARRRGF